MEIIYAAKEFVQASEEPVKDAGKKSVVFKT